MKRYPGHPAKSAGNFNGHDGLMDPLICGLVAENVLGEERDLVVWFLIKSYQLELSNKSITILKNFGFGRIRI
jgi:hypothetical protein